MLCMSDEEVPNFPKAIRYHCMLTKTMSCTFRSLGELHL